MLKKLNNKKGFTLIELMIVIAIIAILAVVLIPNAMKFKENAKTAGVDSNIRQVQATVESIIDDYTTKASFSNALRNRLGTTSLTNPITNLQGASADFHTAKPGTSDNNTAPVGVFYLDSASDDSTFYNADYSTDNSTAFAGMKGSVLVVCYGTTTSLDGVVIYGFDANGNTITSVSKAAKYTIKK